MQLTLPFDGKHPRASVSPTEYEMMYGKRRSYRKWYETADDFTDLSKLKEWLSDRPPNIVNIGKEAKGGGGAASGKAAAAAAKETKEKLANIALNRKAVARSQEWFKTLTRWGDNPFIKLGGAAAFGMVGLNQAQNAYRRLEHGNVAGAALSAGMAGAAVWGAYKFATIDQALATHSSVVKTNLARFAKTFKFVK